jgi:Ca-activated chloride channel family protein
VRFQSVASREGDALRIDYFRGGAPGTTNVRDDGSNSFTLTYRATPELGTPYSPTHQLDFHNSTNRTEVAVRGDAKDVTLLVPARRAATAAISTLAYAPGNEDGFALITVTPPATQRDDAIPRDITLVLDVSGSMSGRKMEQARAAGRQLLATLRPADRFRLIDFSSDVRTFQNEFVSATDANVRQAMRYLDALDASGGTNIEGALREAMRPAIADGRLPIILFLTDGEPTIGERQPDRLASIATDANARSRDTRRIFTFGLGSDVNVSLLETLALEGRGTSQFVRPDESVERTVGIVADRLVGPVLTDVRIHVEGDPRLSKMLPSQPSDLFADHDLVALTRYTGHGQARVVVEGNRRGTPVRWTSTVDLPDRERDNQFVARLWAAQRVGYLSAEKRKHGASQEIDDEIRMLGERYGIPTEFTSYLVTEPQLVANRRGILTPTNAGGAAPPAADQRFEMAKAAAAQRAVGNIASLDSIKAAAPVAGGMARGDVGASPKRIDARTFTLRDSVWTDVRFRAGMETIIIKPYSKAYFDLLTQLPELRSVFALGDRVIVVGKSVAISLDAAKGAGEISASMRATIARAW